MINNKDFEDIRPYYDEEINPALRRLIANPVFSKLPDYFLPGTDVDQLKNKLSGIHTSHDFQAEFMLPVLRSVLEKTSGGLTFSGFEKITRGTPYLFVANHRDIVLDSAILQMLLLTQGYMTTEITFGSNLMQGQFVVDLGKVNKMFKLERSGNKVELLNNSRKTSEYIRHTIVDRKTSVWIAQRPGRTKNGHDKTEAGLLKMLTMSRRCDSSASIRELNIVPVSISYEYEPCCGYKIKELIETEKNGSYCKRHDEDLQSIIKGITQQKGRISLVICDPVNKFLEEAESETSLNKKLGRLAELIDIQMYRNYKLWPGNYIAYDVLGDCDKYSDRYTSEQKHEFLQYMDNELKNIDSDSKRAYEIFLNMYANPVINYLNI
jgi:1-acyl-sn-glycerol-3-phosphate acyltransferase